MRLSVLAAQLTDGMVIDDDDRLKAILELLTGELHLSTHSDRAAHGVDLADLESVLGVPAPACAWILHLAYITANDRFWADASRP